MMRGKGCDGGPNSGKLAKPVCSSSVESPRYGWNFSRMGTL